MIMGADRHKKAPFRRPDAYGKKGGFPAESVAQEEGNGNGPANLNFL